MIRGWSLAFLLLPWSLLQTGCADTRRADAGAAQSPPAVIVPDALTPQRPRDGYVPGVENFGFVSADVWRGGRPTTQGLQTLAAMGVKTVIDLEQTDTPAEVPPGVTLVRLPVSRWRVQEVDTQAVLHAIDDNPKPVFVHCKQGRDRTGLAIAAYRLSQGMSADDAIAELRNFHVNLWWVIPLEGRIRELARDASEGDRVKADVPH